LLGLYFHQLKNDDINKLVARNIKLFENAPGAIGYYVGFKICVEYVKRNGKSSWKNIYKEPVDMVLFKSGIFKDFR